MLNCRARWRVAAICLVVALGGACTSQHPNAPVDIDARVNICVTGGATCYLLGVPEASVEIADSGGQVLATGQTDDFGSATISAPKSLVSGKVTVRSPLFKSGLAEAPLGSVGEGGVSLTVTKELASGAHGP